MVPVTASNNEWMSDGPIPDTKPGNDHVTVAVCAESTNAGQPAVANGWVAPSGREGFVLPVERLTIGDSQVGAAPSKVSQLFSINERMSAALNLDIFVGNNEVTCNPLGP